MVVEVPVMVVRMSRIIMIRVVGVVVADSSG